MAESGAGHEDHPMVGPEDDDDVEIPFEEGTCPACMQRFNDQDKDVT